MNRPGHVQPEMRTGTDSCPRRTPGGPCIGKWKLVACLGGGQWSTVYSARPRDCPDDWPADYAIKIARCGDQRERVRAEQLLAREATVGRTVVHPHLVTVFSAHLERVPPMLVMPRLPGATLEQAIVGQAPFATPHALWIVRQVAEALAALHTAGWVHADVKPGNIQVSSAGHATLIDLGFALSLGTEECAAGGSLRGSLTYTAPEMISSAVAIDQRCDIYSLGVTLFELLTGTPPFVERDPGPMMLAHMQRQIPDPRRKLPSLHRGVWELLQDMLAKQPLRRPGTQELVDRLVDLEIATFDERVA